MLRLGSRYPSATKPSAAAPRQDSLANHGAGHPGWPRGRSGARGEGASAEMEALAGYSAAGRSEQEYVGTHHVHRIREPTAIFGRVGLQAQGCAHWARIDAIGAQLARLR